MELRGLNLEDSDCDGVEMPSPEVKDLVVEYKSIFQLPMRLPTKREANHRILLKKGQPPVDVRPYKYSHAQKLEIERLVSEIQGLFA